MRPAPSATWSITSTTTRSARQPSAEGQRGRVFVATHYQSNDGTGVIFITTKPTTRAILDKAAADLGLNFTAVTARPAGATYQLTKPRIGLWDQYGGSMPSGHLRWLLEQFEFDFERVFPQTLDAGNLRSKFDVLLFPDGGIPETDNAGGGFGGGGGRPPNAQDIPEEFRGHLGRVSIKSTVPQLKAFAEAGGVIVAFGGSAVLGHHLGLPVSDHLVEVARMPDSPLPCTSTTSGKIDCQRRRRQHTRRRLASRRRSTVSRRPAWSWRRTLRSPRQPGAWFDSRCAALRRAWGHLS